METSKTAVNRETVANDYAQAMKGKLDDAKVAKAVAAIKADDVTGYAANGSIASLIFYVKVQLTITSTGNTFNGNAGGIFTPGGGALFGTVYTSDLNALIQNTTSFQITSTPVYLSIIFWDENGNVLGTWQAGGISTVLGTGGGSGSF